MASSSLARFWRFTRCVVPPSLALALALLLAAWLSLLAPTPVDAKTITLSDNGQYPCTNAGLNAAIAAADTGDEIQIVCPHSIPITLTLVVTKNLSFTGRGTGPLTVTAVPLVGSGATRVLSITSGVQVTVTNVIISHGVSVDAGAGIFNQGRLALIDSGLSGNFSMSQGGAVYNEGLLSLECTERPPAAAGLCEVSGNHADVKGGGIYNVGIVNVKGYSFSYNNSLGQGGALRSDSGGNATIANSEFLSNTAVFGGGLSNGSVLSVSASLFVANVATNDGGGIDNQSGMLTVDGSTFSGNSAGNGAAIESAGAGMVMLSNSTLNTNSAGGNGGGIDNNGSNVFIINSTFASNNSGASGNLHNTTGAFGIRNTIVAFGVPVNCTGTIGSAGHNLESANTCNLSAAGDLSNTSPLLAPLQNNGGPLLPDGQAPGTRALVGGSPAIDHGDNSGCPATDERGAARPFNAICDIGAYEFGAKIAQTISFPPIGDKSLFESPVTPDAWASSGLPASYTASGQCFVSGGGSQLTLTAIGSCTAVAHQAGNGNYFAATNVTQTFNIVYKTYLPIVQR